MGSSSWGLGIATAALVLSQAGALPAQADCPARVNDLSTRVKRITESQLLERVADTSAARAGYLRAAQELPCIADWLYLRAGALTPDSAGRYRLYQRITNPVAMAQVQRVEARAREAGSDFAGALTVREALGDGPEVLRLRLLLAPDSFARRAVLALGLDRLDHSAGSATGRFVAVLAPFADQLKPAERIRLARAAAAQGAPQALDLYRGVASTLLRGPDHLALGDLLAGRREFAAADQHYRMVRDTSLVYRAMGQRGRALIRSGRTREGQAVLAQLVKLAPGDSASGRAHLLLADISRDAGDYRAARTHWLRARDLLPDSLAARARFMAAMVLWQQRQFIPAAEEWDSLHVAARESDDGLAAAYWSGRAWDRAGRAEKAVTAWETVIRETPLSYYTDLALRRLGRPRSAFVNRIDTTLEPADLATARRRMELLQAAGLTTELASEQAWAESHAGTSTSRLLATGAVLAGTGATWQATRLGWRVWRRNGPGLEAARLIFPLQFDRDVRETAERIGIEPPVLAAVIRQESVFDSGAVSRAGARGLMQVMPSLGQRMAQARGWSPWHADSLFNPVRNLELGTSYLAGLYQTYAALETALAAYNAGPSRVQRWLRQPGANDPEVFVEWIPFSETRSYVKTVVRNVAIYRSLYSWGG